MSFHPQTRPNDPTIDQDLANKGYTDAHVAYFNSNKKSGTVDDDRFFPLFSDSTSGAGVESVVQVTIDDAFIVTRTRCVVDANTKDAASTVHFRDDAADVTSITVPLGTTGQFDSGVVSVAVAAGSACNHRIDTSLSTSGTLAVNVMMTRWIRA